MRNNKRSKPGLSPTLLCSVMECYSNPQLPWILSCMAAIQNKNLLHCTLDVPTLMVLSMSRRGTENPGSRFSWQALSTMSSDVGVCSGAAGKQDKEGRWAGGTVSLILWMQPTVLPACLTHAAPHYNQQSCHSDRPCAPSPQHQSHQISFFLIVLPLEQSREHRKHVSLMCDTHSIWLMKRPQRHNWASTSACVPASTTEPVSTGDYSTGARVAV